jgi:hypothetical protein
MNQCNCTRLDRQVGKGEYLVGGVKVDQKRVVEGGDLTLDGTGANA